jgi:hypothetical protein
MQLGNKYSWDGRIAEACGKTFGDKAVILEISWLHLLAHMFPRKPFRSNEQLYATLLKRQRQFSWFRRLIQIPLFDG